MMNFRQKERESYHRCWEHFNELLLARPHHGFEMWHVIGLVYDGVNFEMRQFVEMMCNRDSLQKIPMRYEITFNF